MGQDNYQQDNYAQPVIMQDTRADLLDKIQPTLILDVIFHSLMGEEFKNGKWIRDPELTGTSLTKIGAWKIRTLMTPVSSQNVSLSKLKDAEIRARTLNTVRCSGEMCLRNWRSYGIKGTDDFSFIHQIVMSNSLITLKQSEGEGIRNMIKNIGNGDIGQQEQPMGIDTFRR